MLNVKINKILVCYLFTKFDNKKTLINFIGNYKKHKSGVKHDLLICFKLLNSVQINSYRSILKNIKHIEYIDNSQLNDFDFGSYMRVAQKHQSFIILFLNGHSYPITNDWLKKMLFHFKSKTLIGTTASNESLLTSLRFKKFYKFFHYFHRFFKYKKQFKSFPNPHVRTTGFMLKGSDFLRFARNMEFKTKEHTWMAESGINGMTNFFIKKKFNIYIVNSDGKRFTKNEWMLSETYNYALQSKSLVSDKHSRKYLKLPSNKRILSQKINWG